MPTLTPHTRGFEAIIAVRTAATEMITVKTNFLRTEKNSGD